MYRLNKNNTNAHNIHVQKNIDIYGMLTLNWNMRYQHSMHIPVFWVAPWHSSPSLHHYVAQHSQSWPLQAGHWMSLLHGPKLLSYFPTHIPVFWVAPWHSSLSLHHYVAQHSQSWPLQAGHCMSLLHGPKLPQQLATITTVMQQSVRNNCWIAK